MHNVHDHDKRFLSWTFHVGEEKANNQHMPTPKRPPELKLHHPSQAPQACVGIAEMRIVVVLRAQDMRLLVETVLVMFTMVDKQDVRDYT